MSAAPPAAPPTKKHKHDEEDDKPLVPKDEDDPDKPLVPQDPDTTYRAGEPVCIIFYTRVDDFLKRHVLSRVDVKVGPSEVLQLPANDPPGAGEP